MSVKSVLVLVTLAVSELLAQTGARYLIITHDAYYDAIQPLAQWKHKKGMQCRVVKTSEAGGSASQIQAYIRNAYSTWNPRPEFVLLVGSANNIPAFPRGWGQDLIYTDNPYGDISGDYRAELPYGRFSCRTVGQCSVMVAKTLAYERTPYFGDTMWYHKGTEVIRDSGDGDAFTYWSDARIVAGLARQNGYTAMDSLASSHHHTAYDVVQSINAGTSFVLYRGTGAGNWYAPFAVDPGQTSNGTRLPIINSFTCQTMTLVRNESMVGEAWLRTGTPQALKGAVAFVGNVHNAAHVAQIRSAMTRGYFAGVFSESLQYLGSAMLRGKLQIFNEYHDSMEYMGFNLLGDPELSIWTRVPKPLEVQYDSVVPLGPGTFTVTVLCEGTPVGNALACIQCPANAIYQYGYTNAAGQYQFSINPGVEGILEVTVTNRNCIPHEGTARIVTTSIAARPALRLPLSAFRIAPNPGTGLFAVNCAANTSVRIFTTSGRLVAELRTALATRSPYQTSLIWDARDAPAGIYVVRATSPGGESAARMLQIVR